MASTDRSPPSTTSSTTVTTTITRPPTAALLIYPVTLLVGSLFSILSPTARGSRNSAHEHPTPLAPSIAAGVNLSPYPPPSPVNYFARKTNIFNLYFVKIGWVWTTLAFVSLLLFQPAFMAPSSHRSRRLAQACLRYALATSVWYLMTQWFFGPAIIDRFFVITGGKCQQIAQNLASHAAQSSSAVSHDGYVSVELEKLFTAGACKSAGGTWAGGHDVSGHVFMLVLMTSMLAFETFGATLGLTSLSATKGAGAKKEDEEGDSLISREDGAEPNELRVWTTRFVWAVVGLGWWMLFMTAIWFHTWVEKWTGLIIALGTVYGIYILPRNVPSWRNIVGIPGV